MDRERTGIPVSVFHVAINKVQYLGIGIGIMPKKKKKKETGCDRVAPPT